MNSTEHFAAKLTNAIYCICSCITIIVMFHENRMLMAWRWAFTVYLLLSVALSQYITHTKRISNLIQGRVEIILFLFLSFFFGYNVSWGRIMLAMTFSLVCLFSVYQLPQLNAELLGMTILLYGVLLCFYGEATMAQYYSSRREVFVELGLLLFAQLIMYFLQKQNAFERRKVYENEQSLDDLLKVVELKCDEAQEAVRVKSSFLANMSHEIRTPINAILGMNEMILRETRQDDIAEYAQNVQSAGKSLTVIINDILDFSKMESGKLQLVSHEYSFSSMLNDIMNLIQERAAEKGLSLSVEVDERIPDKLYGDEVRVKQICTNLLNNAVKYTRTGTVRFIVQGKELSDDQAQLCMKIVDTGIGIKDEDKDKLFRSFMRLDLNRNRNIEGTGLGLVITRQLVAMCGGTIEVESEYGRGSCFTVTLPQQVLDPTPIGNYQRRYEDGRASRNLYREAFVAPSAHVLIVDDNIINLKVAAALLKETQVQIDLGTSGMECLEKCSQRQYDLILMDHMMPQMDGIETLHRIRQREEENGTGHIAVIALTANAVYGAKEMYLQAGFDNYLSKPIETEKLEGMLKRYLAPELVQVVEEQQRDESIPQDLTEIPMQENLTAAEPEQTGEKCEELIQYFEATADTTIEQLTDCRNRNDWRSFAVLLRGLYSLARGLGFTQLMELCRQEETTLREQKSAYTYEGLGSICSCVKEANNRI